MNAPLNVSDRIAAEFGGDLARYMKDVGQTARSAASDMAAAATRSRNAALIELARRVRTDRTRR